jgi:putative two-component system hydrogenase maturation factor HypX/HoxX
MALRLTQGCAPLGTRRAKAIGLIDDAFGEDVGDFETHVRAHAQALAQHPRFSNLLEAKQERRIADERKKPLASYRREELAQMRLNFYGSDPTYHEARRRFVYKGTVPHHPADQPEHVRHAVTSSGPEARA